MDDTLQVEELGVSVSGAARIDLYVFTLWVFVYISSMFLGQIYSMVFYVYSSLLVYYWVYRFTGVTSFSQFLKEIDLNNVTFSAIGIAGGIIILDTFVEIVVRRGFEWFNITSPAHDIVNSYNLGDPVIGFGFILFFFFIVGPVEEIVFRYGLQRRVFRENWGLSPLTSIALVSLLFSSGHLFSYGLSLNSIVPVVVIFISSVLYGFSYYRLDNLLVPILAHAGGNSLAVVFILFS